MQRGGGELGDVATDVLEIVLVALPGSCGETRFSVTAIHDPTIDH